MQDNTLLKKNIILLLLISPFLLYLPFYYLKGYYIAFAIDINSLNLSPIVFFIAFCENCLPFVAICALIFNFLRGKNILNYIFYMYIILFISVLIIFVKGMFDAKHLITKESYHVVEFEFNQQGRKYINPNKMELMYVTFANDSYYLFERKKRKLYIFPKEEFKWITIQKVK